MLARVGREIGPHLRRGQLVLSACSPARRPTALTGILGHDQVVRSMPNTPARLGKGMTVWYATPETTDEQRAQAAALLGALGAQLEVDDEKMVAMATAVSGTGPTYVFLVMEALIDAAVHLGFPRHIAHDLVIETLEGSTLFAKQSGMHPAELRNMVTSPGGTSRGGAPRARVRAAADRPVRGGLGGLPADRRARRPARGDRPRAAARRRPGEGHRSPPERRPMTPGRDAAVVDLRRAPLAALRGVDLRATRARPVGRRGRTLGSARRVVGRASTTRPGTCRARRRPMPAARTGRWPSTSATSRPGRSWRSTTRAMAIATGRWPTDDEYDGGDFDRYNERLREPWASQPRDAILRPPGRPPGTGSSRRPSTLSPTAHPRRRRVGLGLHDPARPLPRPPRGHRAVGRRRSAPARPTATRSSPTRGPPTTRRSRAQEAAATADLDDAAARRSRMDRWMDGEVTARLDGPRPRRPPGRLGRGRRPGDRGLPPRR